MTSATTSADVATQLKPPRVVKAKPPVKAKPKPKGK
jgi:hypothetical protein